MVRTVNDPATLANRLRPVLLRIARELRRETHALGISSGQVTLLIQIGNRPGITASELAEVERMSAPGMSGHIVRLEAAGLIERTRAADRRRIGLEITPAAETMLADVRHRRTVWLNEHLRGLTDEERDALDAAIPALEKLLDA